MRSVDGYGMIDEREKDKCLFRKDRHCMVKPKYYLVERTLLPEAHSYIEQQAMNQRRSKRDIAEDIIGGKTP